MTTSKLLSVGAVPVSSEAFENSRFVTGLMVFLGSFLAFSMEPVVGRLITPFFGGAIHVWTVSLMVFQALLFCGYLYAHLIAPRIGVWHLLFLLLPLLQWPLGFASEVAPKAPIAALIVALLAQISLPFAALSTTAVVAQSWWFCSSTNPRCSSPFFLYGISNLGAMVALFAYPFCIEPLFGITVQRMAWSIGYLFYIAVTAWTMYLLRPQRKIPKIIEPAVLSPSWHTIASWLVLSAAPSALLLSVTNVIAMEVGSFPMVWVFPLALYLASFIVTFRDKQGAVSRINFWLIDIVLLALVVALFLEHGIWALLLILLTFYALCIITNERLYFLRPHPSQLTRFYLIISVGGWIGGLLVCLVAPLFLTGLDEYPISVIVIAIACWQPRMLSWWKSTSITRGGFRLAILMVGSTVIGLSLWYTSNVYSLRNFYGISKIIDKQQTESANPYRMLVHGKTLHGLQYLNLENHQEPLGYYYRGGALEKAVSLRNRPARIAMVGLGAGGAMPWFGKGEEVAIFEIDQDMETVARNWFTYLEKSPAQTNVAIGDARLNLALESKNNVAPYDVIFIDAFSGDGIPTHLITLEALDIYLSRLKTDGLLVFHVSNRYYDLRPILKAAAQSRRLAAVTTMKSEKTSDHPLRINPVVVVLAQRPELISPLLVDGQWSVLGTDDSLPEVGVWTDDYVTTLVPFLINWFR